MITSQNMSVISGIYEGEQLKLGQLSYFRARLRSRFHDLILKTFLHQKESGLTKAELAERLGKSPAQITRWLTAPGNMTLDTISDLLLAMKMELVISAKPLSFKLESNEYHSYASMQPKEIFINKTTIKNIKITGLEVS